MPKTQFKPDWSQFLLRIYIKKSQAQVFKAWTDDKIVEKWFSVEAEIEPKKGGRVHFRWLGGDEMDDKVIKIVKNRSFTFPFGPKDGQVEVKFRKKGKGCVCELRQYNMAITERAKWNFHKGCSNGWTFFLANLKSVLENGIDLRSHDSKMSYRQGFINS